MGTSVDTKVNELWNELTKELKPETQVDNIRPDLDSVNEVFPKEYRELFTKKYDSVKVPAAKAEEAYREASKLFISILYKLLGKPQPLVDGPEWYATAMSDWARKVSPEHEGIIKEAIKQGDVAELLKLFVTAYKAQATKLPARIADLQSQPSEIQMAFYQKGADTIAGSSKGDVAKVATDVPGFVRNLGQYLALQRAYSKN